MPYIPGILCVSNSRVRCCSESVCQHFASLKSVCFCVCCASVIIKK